MNPLPIFIDFEASSLSHASYPIEVGWSDASGVVESWLISPAGIADWNEWNTESERVHGIAHQELLAEGQSPLWVCRRIEEVLGGATLYSDAPPFETMWLERLFAACGRSVPDITVASVDDLLLDMLASRMADERSPRLALSVLKLHARNSVAGRHRAGWDVEYLVELWHRCNEYEPGTRD